MPRSKGNGEAQLPMTRPADEPDRRRTSQHISAYHNGTGHETKIASLSPGTGAEDAGSIATRNTPNPLHPECQVIVVPCYLVPLRESGDQPIPLGADLIDATRVQSPCPHHRLSTARPKPPRPSRW